MEDQIQRIVESVIPTESVFIVELVARGRQGSRTIEVFLDADEGVGLDELARFSREIGFLLEGEDIVKGRYRLNVSSPGADRPLRHPRQFGKHVGRTLSVTCRDDSVVQGELKEASADQITLSGSESDLVLAFDHIKEAKVVLPW